MTNYACTHHNIASCSDPSCRHEMRQVEMMRTLESFLSTTSSTMHTLTSNMSSLASLSSQISYLNTSVASMNTAIDRLQELVAMLKMREVFPEADDSQ